MSSAADQIVPKLKQFATTPMRYKIAYGGRGSGKSWSVAKILVEIARRARVRILCARELQGSIDESVKQLLADTIERAGCLGEFDILKKEIIHKATGSRFLFAGLRHNITSIKSMEAIDICWVEEAENVSEESWLNLIPTIRKEHSEIWVTFNPKNQLDATYQRFVVNPPSNAMVIKVNFDDNPFFPDELRQEMEDMKRKDYELYRHVWLGEPVADSEEAFIKPAWLEAAIDAHLKLDIPMSGICQIGYDVADEGEDFSAIVERNGSVITGMKDWQASRMSLEKITEEVYNYACMANADLIVYDGIGIGAGAKVVFNRLSRERNNAIKTIPFIAGGKVLAPNAPYTKGVKRKNRDMFGNIKAQKWWEARVRLKNTYNAITEGQQYRADEMLSLSSDIQGLDVLMSELSRPRIDYDNNGKVLVESKRNLKKRKIPSPNRADAFIMSIARLKGGTAGLIC